MKTGVWLSRAYIKPGGKVGPSVIPDMERQRLWILVKADLAILVLLYSIEKLCLSDYMTKEDAQPQP